MSIWKRKPIWMVVAIVSGIGTIPIWNWDHPVTDDERIIMISASTSSSDQSMNAPPQTKLTVAEATSHVFQPPIVALGATLQTEDHHQSDSLQNRDARWAAPTERDIVQALRQIPYLAGGSEVSVRCGNNLCEAEGQIDSKASTENRKLAILYLEGMDFAEHLGSVNALADEVVMNHQSGAFTIRFSRVHR